VAAGAHREAADQYARALRYAGSLGDAERAELASAFAHEAELTGRLRDAIETRREAIALYRALGDLHAEGRELARLTVPYTRLGDNAEAEGASLAAIDLLEPLPASRELGGAYAMQSYLRMLARDNAAGVSWGEKAVAVARPLGDNDTLCFGLNMIGTSLVMAGEIDRGIELLIDSLEVGRASGLEYRIWSALGMLGSGLAEMYELERAERYLDEQIAFAEERDMWSHYSQAWRSLVDVYRGRFDDGAERAHDLTLNAPDPLSRISALIALGRVRARRGDPGAGEALDEALDLARPGGHLQRLGHVHAARAEAAWLSGDADATVAEALAVYPLAVEKCHLWFAGELAYWQWKGGALERPPDWIAAPYRLQLEGEARLAAREWRRRGCPYEEARALADTQDERALRAALSTFERLGAVPAANEARRALRVLGASVPRGPRPTTRANPLGLTARELEVLRCLVAGKRNADIAGELVLSVRTVDHHVAAILRKLGVRTRGEAAAAAAELGLDTDG